MKTFIKYLVVLFFFQIALSGCGLIVYKLVYKAKIIPKYTSEKKIRKFYKKHAATQDNLVFLSDSAFVQKIEEPGWGFESWKLYNDNGQRLRIETDSIGCFGNVEGFFRDFKIEFTVIDSSEKLSIEYFENQKLQNLSLNSQVSFDSDSKYDYTLVLYWSKWRGRFSERILDLEKLFVLNNPELRIRVIKVNMDFRDDMKDTWIDKMDIWSREVTRKKNDKDNRD